MASTTADADGLRRVFETLRPILTEHAGDLIVLEDTLAKYALNTRAVTASGQPVFFGAVEMRKNYVSFHIFAVYMFPELLEGIGDLRKRMQGKSCFNFRKIDDALVGAGHERLWGPGTSAFAGKVCLPEGADLGSDAPEVDQRAGFAEDRVHLRQRDGGDVPVGARPLLRAAGVEIPDLVRRVGANDDEVIASAQVLVGDSGGDHDDIARFEIEDWSCFAAELRTDGTGRDAQHFMGRAVVVMVREDAVAPDTAPALLVEPVLDDRGGVLVIERDRLTVDHNRQCGIVGKGAVIRQQVGADRIIACSRMNLDGMLLVVLRHGVPARHLRRGRRGAINYHRYHRTTDAAVNPWPCSIPTGQRQVANGPSMSPAGRRGIKCGRC